MAIETTAGKAIINYFLPKDLRTDEEIDSKNSVKLFTQLAEKYPDQFASISIRLANIGADASTRKGGPPLRWDELAPIYSIKPIYEDYYKKALEITLSPDLSEKQKLERIINYFPKYEEATLKEALKEVEKRQGSIFAQYKSGTRGKPTDIRRLLSGDVIYVDHRGQPIPVPITRGFSQGLTPAQYWFHSYGTRKSLIDVALGTATSAYLYKQLAFAAHRLIVQDVDGEDRYPTMRGLPVDIDDEDNVGAFLAAPTDKYPRNTLLTPEILADLRTKGYDQILIRSVAVRKTKDGGVYSRDVGTFEGGRLFAPGDQVGIIASQSLGEPITQMAVGSKHGGGVLKTTLGFDTVQRFLQATKNYQGGRTHAEVSGRVTKIEKAPAGGHIVYVENVPHFVSINSQVTVQPGDIVEEGDSLSDGIPNPAKLVAHKGLGEGKRQYIEIFRDLYRQLGFNIHRRNFEIVTAALLDYVRLTQPYKNFLPGEVLRYSWLEQDWEPREGAITISPEKAIGKYLEIPILHYTIGTKVLPSTVQMLKKFGIEKITVHNDPPPFENIIVPAAKQLDYDPDWLVRFLGGTKGIERSLLEAMHTGQVSQFTTSFVPALALGQRFGERWPATFLSKNKDKR